VGLFKEVKKPVIKGASAGNGDVSPLRPRYVEKTPPCADRCPHGNDIRGVLVGMAQHEAYGITRAQAFEQAWRRITQVHPFPAVLGRLCQHPCESGCNRKAKDGGVGVHLLERFLGDYAIEHGLKFAKPEAAQNKRIAIVGAGPAGLACAYHLARRGYGVTVFDAAAQPGGMMRYRMPRSTLPLEVLDAEIVNVLALGIELRSNCQIGRDSSLEELLRNYAGVFFATGLQKAALLAPRRDGEGAVIIGDPSAAVPDCACDSPLELDARVANSISPAVAQGREVAESIDAFLNGRAIEAKSAPPVIKSEKMNLDWYPAATPHADIPLTMQLSEEEVISEAKRCLSCGMCMDCETCWMYCSSNCFVKLSKGEHYKIKLELCNGCKKCAEVCPCGYIELN
jgi:NADPH-dependent glutamate synthase beta subunit-like oxidoreductase